jgi:hypothetical protein
LATAAAAAIADIEAGHQVQLNSRAAATAREKRESDNPWSSEKQTSVFYLEQHFTHLQSYTQLLSKSMQTRKNSSKNLCVCVGVCEFSLSLSFFLSGSLSLNCLSFLLSVWCSVSLSLCLSLSLLLCLLAVSLF